MGNKMVELMENCKYNMGLDVFEKHHIIINDRIAWYFDQYNKNDSFGQLSLYLQMVKKGKAGDLKNSKNKYTGRLDNPLSKYILSVKSLYIKNYKGEENLLEVRPNFNPDTLTLTFIVYPEGDTPKFIKSTKTIDSYIVDGKVGLFRKSKKVFNFDVFVDESILEVAPQLNDAIIETVKNYFTTEEETAHAN